MVGKLGLITHFVPNFPLLNPKKEKEKERYATVSPASSGSLCRIQKQTNKTNQLSWTQKKATATNIHNTDSDSEFSRHFTQKNKQRFLCFVLSFYSYLSIPFHGHYYDRTQHSQRQAGQSNFPFLLYSLISRVPILSFILFIYKRFGGFVIWSHNSQVLLGDMGAGKSSLVLRFVKGQFLEYQVFFFFFNLTICFL